MIDKVCDYANEMYLQGDFNINWNSSDCPLKHKLLSITDACGLTQNVTKPTRVCLKRDGSKTSTCVDPIFTNSAERCTNVTSMPLGCNDHN